MSAKVKEVVNDQRLSLYSSQMADDRGEQVEVSIEIEASLEPATTAKPGQPDEEEVRTKTAPVAVDEEEVHVTTTPVADEEEMRLKTTPSLEPAIEEEEEVCMKIAPSAVAEEEVRTKTVSFLEPAVAEEEVRMKTGQTLEPAEVDKEEVPAPSFRDSEAVKTDPGSSELTSKIGQPQSLSQGHSDPNTTQDGVHFRDCGIPDELVDFPRDDDGIIHLEDVQISKPTPVPSKLAGITKDDDPRLHRHVSRRRRQVKEPHSLPTFAVPILAEDDSAWEQVDAALKNEDREDILKKVYIVTR